MTDRQPERRKDEAIQVRDTQTYIDRITRDISDGLILIDSMGTIRFVNQSAYQLLEWETVGEGTKYSSLMEMDRTGENDEFHQFLLDSIYDKQRTHRGTVRYICPSGIERYFTVTTSVARENDQSQAFGIILQFSDITDLHREKVKHDDSIKVLVALIAMLSIWNFIYIVWLLRGQPISSSAMTLIIELIGVIGAVFALKYTSITVADLGLGVTNLKRSIVFNSILTVSVLALMIIAKLIVLKFFPNVFGPGAKLLIWDKWSISDSLYFVTVIAQEFLTRGVVQGSLESILPENYPSTFAIIVSSLFFGAIHLHKGLGFMLGAAALLSVFGFIYKKHGTIWGLCIPHYVLGLALEVIWGLYT